MDSKAVFSQLKVIDFGTTVVGPSSTRVLADYGATVIKVETNTHVDGLRTSPPYPDGIVGINRSGYFNSYNAGKYSVSLNLKLPKAVEVAKKLVKWGDVVVESYRPGIMEKWGLTYEELRKVKPDLIMVSTNMLGLRGPHSQFRGYGQHGGAIAGWGSTIGWPDRAPLIPFGAYTDYIAGRYVAIAILGALEYRRRTGKGQYIENSQVECSIDFQGPLILDYGVNRRLIHRQGNRNADASPHGAYRCKGEDRWCAIAVATDEEWKSFCRVIGDPSWTKESRFSTHLGRKENEDELDRLVEEWTGQYSPEEVEEKMQRGGVSAGVVKNWADMSRDPQLRYRGHFRELNHTEIGPHTYETYGFRLSKTPGGPVKAAPCLGEHNEYVFTGILGLSPEDFGQLRTEGIFE